MPLVEVDASLRASATLVGVADQRAEVLEELVAELGHGGSSGTRAELAAVAVSREASGLGDGLGFSWRPRVAGERDAALDAADELEHGVAVRERALPEVRDAALARRERVGGSLRRARIPVVMGVQPPVAVPRPCERCGGFLCGPSEHTPLGGECLVERLAVDVDAAAVAHRSEPSAVDAAADCFRRRSEVLGGLLDGEPAGRRLGVEG